MLKVFFAGLVILFFGGCNDPEEILTAPPFLEKIDLKVAEAWVTEYQDPRYLNPDINIRVIQLEAPDFGSWIAKAKAFKFVCAADPASKQATVLVQIANDNGSGGSTYEYYKFTDLTQAICPPPSNCRLE
jgi:hypothetical protein